MPPAGKGRKSAYGGRQGRTIRGSSGPSGWSAKPKFNKEDKEPPQAAELERWSWHGCRLVGRGYSAFQTSPAGSPLDFAAVRACNARPTAGASVLPLPEQSGARKSRKIPTLPSRWTGSSCHVGVFVEAVEQFSRGPRGEITGNSKKREGENTYAHTQKERHIQEHFHPPEPTENKSRKTLAIARRLSSRPLFPFSPNNTHNRPPRRTPTAARDACLDDQRTTPPCCAYSPVLLPAKQPSACDATHGIRGSFRALGPTPPLLPRRRLGEFFWRVFIAYSVSDPPRWGPY